MFTKKTVFFFEREKLLDLPPKLKGVDSTLGLLMFSLRVSNLKGGKKGQQHATYFLPHVHDFPYIWAKKGGILNGLIFISTEFPYIVGPPNC